MNDARGRRLAAITGLALAAGVAVWWLGSTRLALDSGADASRAAAATLQSVWLARAGALVLVGQRVGALCGWRAGVAASFALVAPSWPVVALAWSASTAPWPRVALAEALLLLAGLTLPLLGQALQRALRRADLAEALATLLAVALAAVLWFTRSAWALPPG